MSPPYTKEYPEYALRSRKELRPGVHLYFAIIPGQHAAFHNTCHPEVASALFDKFSDYNESSIQFVGKNPNGLALDGEMTYTWDEMRGFFFTNYFHALAFVLQGKHKISRRT